MQYFGGKQRISKDLGKFLNAQLDGNQPFVDLFCGSCNIITKIEPNRIRIANDKHKYLIAMWSSYSKGRELPNKVTKEDYEFIKKNIDTDPPLAGFVGFGMSFGGKWFGGFTGEVSKNGQDYLKCAVNGIKAKLENLKGVQFYNNDYKEVEIPDGSLIYCDIPYKDTTPYCKKEVGVFDHEDFYTWCKNMSTLGNKVFVSEYMDNVPPDATVVWSKESGTTNAAWQGRAKKTVEVLYTW